MKEHIKKVINFIKKQEVEGCIAGSCLLDYFPDQDVDIFLYSKSSFIKLYYTLKFNKKFLILDPVQDWIGSDLEADIDKQFRKRGIVSIKFVYNTCVTVNLVWKYDSSNIYSVLSSFDLNIICKGYDILTKKTHDYTYGSTKTRIADWNRLNPKFYKSDLWSLNSILRQFLRVLKYYDRKYDVDLVVLHYIKIIKDIQNIDNIFSSENYANILDTSKKNTKIIKQILEVWLKDHKLTNEELELLTLKIKEI